MADLNIIGSGGGGLGGIGVVAYVTPDVLAVIGSGGGGLGGEGIIAYTDPETLEVIGEGGWVAAGKGVIVFVAPMVAQYVGSGGVKFGGEGVIGFSLPGGVQDLAIVGSGGMVLSGTGEVGLQAPDILAIVGSGGMVFGGFRVPEYTVVQFIAAASLILEASTNPVNMEMGGEGLVVFFRPSIYEVPGPQVGEDATFKVGGQGTVTFIHPQILEVIAQGEFTIGAEPVDDEVFETWVLTGMTYEPAIFSGFNFNSFALHHGQPYGAGEDGIYLLDGLDDDGTEIHTGVRIITNLGNDQAKRLRAIQFGKGGPATRIKVTAGNEDGREGYFGLENSTNRIQISRDMQAEEFTIDVADFEQLSQFEISSLRLAKR